MKRTLCTSAWQASNWTHYQKSLCLLFYYMYFILVSDYIIHPARSFSVTSALGRKINTRRPRPPCYERALINAICKVKYAPNLEHLLPTNQRCQRSTSKQWLLEKKGLHEVRIFNYISVVFWKINFFTNNWQKVKEEYQGCIDQKTQYIVLNLYKSIKIEYVWNPNFYPLGIEFDK